MKVISNTSIKEIVLLTCTIFLVVLGYSQNSEIEKSFKKFENKIDSIVSNNRLIPGVAITIFIKDSVDFTRTFGFSNLQTKQPISDSTLFCLSSCTKSFIGLAALKLVEEGMLDVNTPLSEIVPEINIENPWEETHPLRVIHLLEHTSGFEDSHPNWFYFDGPLLSIYDAIIQKQHLFKVRWKPGTRFCYSSPGYTLAGYIIEKVSNDSLSNILKEYIYSPAGMDNSVFGNSYRHNQLLATGYDKQLKEYPEWYDIDEPAGAMFSSASDMNHFLKYLLKNGGDSKKYVVKSDWINQLAKPETGYAAHAGIESGYGYGVGTTYKYGVKWHGHSGAVPGFLTCYYYSKEQNIGFAILQNQFDMTFEEKIFNETWKFIKSLIILDKSKPDDNIYGKNVDDFAGYYEPGNPSLDFGHLMDIIVGGIKVTSENDTLFTKSFGGNKRKLHQVSDNLFKKPTEPEATIAFIKNEDGRMVLVSRNSYYQKIPSWKPLLYRLLFFSSLTLILSVIPVIIIMGVVNLFKRLMKKKRIFKFQTLLYIPFLGIISLVIGILPFLIQQPTVLELGQQTFSNMLLCISTYCFAGLSFIGTYFIFKNLKSLKNKLVRIYLVLVYFSNFGLTICLIYWDIIGVKLWA